MARQKKPATPNGERVTNRDVLAAVQAGLTGVHTRIDDVNKRVDESLDGQRALSGQMTQLHEALHELRKTTNDALHGIDQRVEVLEMPWKLISNGWLKAGAFAGAASAITSFILKFGFPWPF